MHCWKCSNLRLKYALCTGAVGAYFPHIASSHSDSMNCNVKQMKPEATHLTEAQRCEVIAKLSEPNASSKRATFDDADNEECCVVMLEDVDEVLETMRIEEESPIDDKIQPIETFVASESATDFKGFGALHNVVFDIDDQLICYDVQTEVGQMYDELQ